MIEVHLKPSAVQIFQFLYEHGPSTGKELRDGCGQEDWRKRISELRAAGVPIVDCWETGQDKFGNPKRFKQYWIREVQA